MQPRQSKGREFPYSMMNVLVPEKAADVPMNIMAEYGKYLLPKRLDSCVSIVYHGRPQFRALLQFNFNTLPEDLQKALRGMVHMRRIMDEEK